MCESCSGCIKGSVKSRDRSSTYFVNKKLTGTEFYCCGAVLTEGNNRKRHGMLNKYVVNAEPYFSIENACEAFEDDVGFTFVDTPELPHIAQLPDQLLVGGAIDVSGKIKDEASGFYINLTTDLTEDSDVGLHFNPRLDRRVVVRNHRVKSKWGVEELSGVEQVFPFTQGREFVVTIFVADGQFLIAVNRIHFTSFTFRIKLETLKNLYIDGDIVIDQVKHYDLMRYPPSIIDVMNDKLTLCLPRVVNNEQTLCEISKTVEAISSGCVVEISGRVKLLPQSFHINLQTGAEIWPHPIVLLHVNPRYHGPSQHNEQEVILNTWCNGTWGEEHIVPDSPFTPGQSFNIIIKCNDNSYTIVVNDVLLTEYKHRTFSSRTNTVYISGDVYIDRVFIHSV